MRKDLRSEKVDVRCWKEKRNRRVFPLFVLLRSRKRVFILNRWLPGVRYALALGPLLLYDSEK